MKRNLLALLLLSLCFAARAQSDEELVLGKSFQPDFSTHKKYHRSGNDAGVMAARKKSVVAQYNPVTLVLKGTMYLYQNVLSPQLSRSCPYEITCSNFSKHAIHEFGLVKGVFLSADRVLRCNRIGLLDVSPLSINAQDGSISDPLWQYRSR